MVEQEKKEIIDLSDDTDFDDSDFDEMSPEEIKSLREKYDRAYGEDATAFMDKKEEVDAENLEITRATKAELKERTERTYSLYLVTDQRKEYITDEEGKPVFEQKEDEDGLLVYTADGEPVLDETKQKYRLIRKVSEFIVKRPTDRDKLEFERFGIQNQSDIAKLSPKQAKKVDNLIATFLSKCVIDPKMTPEEWRSDVDQSIYQNLVFRLMTAGMQTNEAVLVDFFTTV